MADEQNDLKKKAHRERRAGRKAERKKKKQSSNDQELTDKQRNPKAFSFNSAVTAERQFRRKQDIDTKKQHVPLVDRSPIEPPPILIAVVGPPKVGKSTLINSLIKLFTKSPLTAIKGPVTIVTGKKRRITFIECNNDINSMIDLAKVADLVLLLCDASFGFEMEVFEFLNICQVHGMPRIMGVLTHLDMIKNIKTLKSTKKTLKHRFWTEVYPGAKLFYLSGILHREYLRNEIKNLGRFISVMKFRPLLWKTSHSYLVADRYEDLTNLELIRQNPKCDRNISLYGYVRGIPLTKNTTVHIAGMGDFHIRNVSHLDDPCPLPETIKKRALVEKEKLIYSPFSGVGGIVYDKDAVYVELGGSHSHKQREDTETNNIVENLINTKETLDIKLKRSQLQIFSKGEKITGDDLESLKEENLSGKTDLYYKPKKTETSELEKELNELRKTLNDNDDLDYSTTKDKTDDVQNNYTILKENKDSELHTQLKTIINDLEKKSLENDVKADELQSSLSEEDNFALNYDSDESDVKGLVQPSSSSDESEDENVNTELKWKDNLAEKARDAFIKRSSQKQNLMKYIYGALTAKADLEEKQLEEDTETKEDEIGGLFRVISQEQQKRKMGKDRLDINETSLFELPDFQLRNWLEPENKPLIENCFVTGKWKESEDAAELLKIDDAEDLSEDEAFGDFEDLETGEKFTGDDKETLKQGVKRKNEDNFVNKEKDERETLADKKRKLKEKFDSEYDNNDKTFYDECKLTAEKQSQLNKTIFENLADDIRVEIEGYRAGMYVRLEFEKVPSEFVNNFDPTYPLVIGALNMGEETVGYVNVKIKKHRWYKRILKTNDPLIISLGWRRFQILPIFSKLEDDLKFRYLKYSPQHVTCNAHFWGPITPQGTGFLALQSCDENSEFVKQNFRIAATGVVQELDKSAQIKKKLKLIGHPLKIYKKTAFIKGMFSSALEVAQFEGARIKTVSGIRGQIKKAVSKPEGCFRATFEDKIQLSDIVFCRTWFKVNVPQFYNPVTTLLLPPDKKTSWRGIRTTGQIKREEGLRNQPNEDSLYKEIVRAPKVFKPLVIPSKLQHALPYRDKPKHQTLKSEKKKNLERVAVVRDTHEQQVSNLMKMLRASFEHKQNQLKQKQKENMEKYRKQIEEEELKKIRKLKQTKKGVMRTKTKAKLAFEAKSNR